MIRPGARLRALAARVCSERTMERFIDPVAADLQAEHADPIRGGRIWRSHSALLLGYLAFAKVFLLCGLFGTRQVWHEWSLEDRRGLVRMLGVLKRSRGTSIIQTRA